LVGRIIHRRKRGVCVNESGTSRTAWAVRPIVVADDRNDSVRWFTALFHTTRERPPVQGLKRKSRHTRTWFRQSGLFFSRSLRAY
jgi:hypothetical protein